ncbi:unnamed protein product [Acanthoscelides obtectus]|uniref:Uncharacterized protein n=1 Tax=Acanthoscelides obtectus TaxID=200917 RepID=A0A9P0M9I2_ACAOB|nr:unnamed protein product [Acanthoscelides obtectus]CAK1648819.1 hypothetical protein AOBTE_LOCUS15900 [Acanthoscelides obtectus]
MGAKIGQSNRELRKSHLQMKLNRNRLTQLKSLWNLCFWKIQVVSNLNHRIFQNWVSFRPNASIIKCLG